MIKRHITWFAIAVVAIIGTVFLATSRGEEVNAVILVILSISISIISYRYYSLYIAREVMKLDSQRATPATRLNNGLDFVPTNKYVLFGHHFAAIAGAGPLVGPVLAAQMGYLPGTLWIVFGVVLAGAVQDFMVLFMSMRRNGRSLGEMIRQEMGFIPGIVALISTFMIIIIVIAVLALIVVRALASSPWGTFSVVMTIPIAIFMGLYSRFIRPGKVAEISIIGLILLFLTLFAGQKISQDPVLAALFNWTDVQICWAIIGYGFIASVLPVWLLLAPRDYLSTFMKIGTIIALALGVMYVLPNLQMPALTPFASGGGPVWAGNLFPFLFITIACGAVSGFHALIASGTTPKMIDNELNARFIGYGGMLMESFVAIMALVAACVIQPGIYFTINSPAAIVGTTSESAALAVTNLGFPTTATEIDSVTAAVGESKIISRVGGAPTLAVGMASIFSNVLGGAAMMGFWYHFVILFEALFILTAVDAGTRAASFMMQDLLGTFIPVFYKTSSWIPNIIGSALAVGAWGYILYQGVIDPLGGINSLWPLFGIANQMLAAIALMLAAVVIFKMKRHKTAWVAIVPAIWLILCTLTAGLQKIFSTDIKIGFLTHGKKFADALNLGTNIAPAKSAQQMSQIIFNDYFNASLTVIFVFSVVCILFYTIISCLRAYKSEVATVCEIE